MSAETIAQALRLKRSGGDWVGACPSCGYRSGFSVTEKDGRLLVYCAAGSCEQPALWAALVKQGLVPERNETPRKRKLTPGEQAREMWMRSGPAASIGVTTIVGDYLRTRGITIPVPPVLRLLHKCRHRSGAVAPAMIAMVEHTEHGSVAIHRTWLRPDGTGKADHLEPNKMSLGPIAGGAIRLAPIGPDGDLAVAEGIESAMSFMQITGGPTWAAISAGGIERLVLPPEARQIVIAADPDERGMQAARIAKHRWRSEGRKVWIAKPTVDGDFNDALRALARRAA